MPAIAFAAPLLPGKTETDRLAMQSCWHGERKAAYEDARRRAGITRESVWIQATRQGDLAFVYLEADDLGAAFTLIGTSDEPFDRWFRDLHGLSLEEGFPPPSKSWTWTRTAHKHGSVPRHTSRPTTARWQNQPNRSERFAVMISHGDAHRTLRIERSIAATPETAWELIADITRMGDWSPETTSAEWTGPSNGPAAGARLKGTNQMGSKKWRSGCVVTACVPGERFAFDVKTGPLKVAGWA